MAQRSEVMLSGGPERIDVSVIETIITRGRGLSVESKKVYSRAGEHFNQYLRDSGQPLTDATVKAYFFTYAPQWSFATFNLKRQALLTLFKHQTSIRDNFLLLAAVDQLFRQIPKKRIDAAVTRERWLDKSEVDRLIAGANHRIGLIVKFLYSTGVRISEMIGVRLIDCQVNGKVAIQVIGKGTKVRIVYISGELYEAIRAEFQGQCYLFETSRGTKFQRENLYRYLNSLGVKVGIDKKIGCHSFRHSAAMRLVELQKNIKSLSRYLGHSKIETTIKFYLHGSFDESIVEAFGY